MRAHPQFSLQKIHKREKYFSLRTLALREFGSIRTHHACLARSAILKSSMSLNPNPPQCLGLVIMLHETQLGFLCPSLLPHPNLRIRELMCSHKLRASLKHDMEYTGTAWTTDLVRTSLLLTDSKLASHPLTLFHTLSFINLKASFLLLPTSEASPNIFLTKINQ